MKYLKLFENHSGYSEYLASSEYLRPNVSHCIQENEVHYNPHTWADEYFTMVARENGTISFNIWKSMGTDMITSISYSTDDGETWTTTNNTDGKTTNLVITVNVNNGDKVLWKGDATQTADYNNDVVSYFSSTCEFDAQGNIMSLLYGDDFKNKTTIETEGCFYYLFSGFDGEFPSKLVDASKVALPATTLADYCYTYMFADCTSLTTAPSILPATTLTIYCYSSMFYGCTSLTTAPELPATELANFCYDSMFCGCTSLTTAPELPAETLVYSCYINMFTDCTSLTTAPILPATTLAEHCYESMFQGCTSLVNAPALPATTLAQFCYASMFERCTNLNYIKAMFTTTPGTDYTSGWVSGVASTGTFIKNCAAAWSTTGVNAVPTGWAVQGENPDGTPCGAVS